MSGTFFKHVWYIFGTLPYICLTFPLHFVRELGFGGFHLLALCRGKPAEAQGGMRGAGIHENLTYKEIYAYIQPQNTIQSPSRQHKAPADYSNPLQTIQSP